MANLNFPRCSPWALFIAPASEEVSFCSSRLARVFAWFPHSEKLEQDSLVGLGVASEDDHPKVYLFFNETKHCMFMFLLLTSVSPEVCSILSSWVGDCSCPVAQKWNLYQEETSACCPAWIFLSFLKNHIYCLKCDLPIILAESGVVNAAGKWGLDLSTSSVSS